MACIGAQGELRGAKAAKPGTHDARCTGGRGGARRDRAQHAARTWFILENAFDQIKIAEAESICVVGFNAVGATFVAKHPAGNAAVSVAFDLVVLSRFGIVVTWTLRINMPAVVVCN